MKYLKRYMVFESMGNIEELFYSISDTGVDVRIEPIKNGNVASIDFREDKIISTDRFTSDDEDWEKRITTLHNRSFMRVIVSNMKDLKEFKIFNIKDDLLFAESYIKDELNFHIQDILLRNGSEYTYYKDIDSLYLDIKPNKKIHGYISILFIKD